MEEKEIVELDDTSIEDKDLRDGLGNLAAILGGLATSALASKEQLEHAKTPAAVKGILGGLGLTAASIIGIGAGIAKFVEKHAPKDKR